MEKVIETESTAVEVAAGVPSVYETFWRENPGQVMEVDINELDVDVEDDVRSETASIDDKSTEFKQFVKVIEHNGAKPLEARVVGGRLKVVDGRRRLAAQKVLGFKTVLVLPAVSDGTDVGREVAITRALALNIATKGISPIERLVAIKKIQAESVASGRKITNREIAEKIGMSQGGLTGYLSLDKYTDDAKEAIHSGKIAYGAAIKLMAENGPESASDVLLALVATADGEGKDKVKGAAVAEASRSARKASGGGSKYQLTSKQAVGDVEKYLKGLQGSTPAEKAAAKALPQFRIGLVLKDWLKMGNDLEKVITQIAKAWD